MRGREHPLPAPLTDGVGPITGAGLALRRSRLGSFGGSIAQSKLAPNPNSIPTHSNFALSQCTDTAPVLRYSALLLILVLQELQCYHLET